MTQVHVRPAISALAWPAEREAEVLPLARRIGFEGVEVAPVRIFGPLAEATVPKLREWRRQTEGLGLQVPAMQGVLFGCRGVHLFRSPEERTALGEALARVALVAAELGAGASVFGAPAMRDPGAMPAHAAWEVAVNFLRGVAARFADVGTKLCFEPVAASLGCRFVTTTHEAVALVAAVGHPGLRLQLDTGNLFSSGHGRLCLRDAIPLVGHVHASEPGLAPLGTTGANHFDMGRKLQASGWSGWVSVEMLPADDVPGAIRGAWELMQRHYLTRE